MRYGAIALLLLAACNGSKPPPRGPVPPPQPSAAGLTHFISDPERRYPAVPATLCSWNRDRYLHFFVEGRPLDVAFLDASGTVVETGRVQDEIGITSKREVRHALFMPAKVGDKPNLGSLISGRVEPMPVVKVGGHAVHVETSHLLAQRQRGLMYRSRMSKDDGMLFLYPAEDTRSFWMMNTLLALDIAYFAEDGRLLNVARMKPAANPSEGGELKAPSAAPARFVLEVNYGWFDARGLIDAEGKPLKPVKIELPDALRRLADQAE